MNKKDSRFLYLITVLPCMFEIFIFQSFRFAGWRREMNSEIQFRILWGSLGIAVFFIVCYGILFFRVKHSYNEKDKTGRLMKISLFAVLGFLSYVIGYFV